jgi:hypothetical protein
MGTRSGRVAACLLVLAGLPLLAAPLVVAPGSAAPRGHPSLRLDEPTLSTARARLTGRAPGGVRTVHLERRTAHGWRTVADLAVHGGRFRGHVVRRAQPQRVRVTAAGRHSQVRRIDARQPVDRCGPRPRRDGHGFWTCTFDDEFDGTAVDHSRWTTVTSFYSGSVLGAGACYLDDPSVVSVGGGALHLSVRDLPGLAFCPSGSPFPLSSHAAGMLTTMGRFSQQYGRFEVRLRPAAVPSAGLQEAFWLWPDPQYGADHPWPASGEIDVVETYSKYPDVGVPFLHYTANDNGGPVPGTNTAWDCHALRGEWHTWTLEWTPDTIHIWVDGRSCLVNTSNDPAFDKRYVVNLTAALGIGDNTYVGGFALPTTLDVDYVRVWK